MQIRPILSPLRLNNQIGTIASSSKAGDVVEYNTPISHHFTPDIQKMPYVYEPSVEMRGIKKIKKSKGRLVIRP